MTDPAQNEAGDSTPPRTPSRLPPETDDNRAERAAFVALGGTLLAVGLKRRSLGGTAAALVGGWLCYRGLGGRGHRYREVDANTEGRDDVTDPETSDDAITVERSITIGASADELYQSWRDPEQLSRVVGHFAEVTHPSEDPDHQRWTVRGPLGLSLGWDAQVVEDRPGELLRWEARNGAALSDEGSVHFHPAPGERGTEVTLRLRFDPPGGPLGAAAMTRLDMVPTTLVGKALRRFKSLVETGEIPTLERNPSARGSGDLV